MMSSSDRRRSGGASSAWRALVLAVMLGVPGLAHAADLGRIASIADPVERAEAYAAAAYEAYSDRDYAAAVALYREAYHATPSADILFNIARIYDVGLGDRDQAVRYYRDYVAHADAGVYRIDLAFERLSRLEGIDRDAKDDQAVEAAQHDAPAEGRVAEVAIVQGPVVAESPPAVGFWTPLRVSAIVAGSAGLIGLGVGAGFGVAALSDARTAREDCDGDVCRTQRGIDAVRGAEKNADLATVCMALGGTLVAAGATLMWWEASSGRDETAQPGITPIATSSQLGLAWSGRW